MNVAAGEAAAAGQRPYQVTTGQRTVTVPVRPCRRRRLALRALSIILPSQATVPGTDQRGGVHARPTRDAPRRHRHRGERPGARVSLAVQSARDVLAVPVSALLRCPAAVQARGRRAVRGAPSAWGDRGPVRLGAGPGQRGRASRPGREVVVAAVNGTGDVRLELIGVSKGIQDLRWPRSESVTMTTEGEFTATRRTVRIWASRPCWPSRAPGAPDHGQRSGVAGLVGRRPA